MDLYSTTALNRVVQDIPLGRPLFFSSSFFTEEERSTTEDIKFDKAPKGRRRITPLVAPLIRGRVILDKGYRTGSVSPAYLKDKRVFDANDPRWFKRTIGEKLTGSLSPSEREAAAIGLALEEQLAMWQLRLEVMAAEVIRTGKIVLESQDYAKNEIDFGRDPSLSVVLTGSDKWTTADFLADIEEWGQAIFDASGYVAQDVLITSDVWKVIRPRIMADDAFGKQCRAQLDMLVATLTQARAELGPVLFKEGVRLVAIFGDYRLWVHSDKYEDPETGVMTPMLPPGSVVMASRDGVEGVRHYGAIKDHKAGLQSLPFFVKSWEEEEPSVRYILGQSAPLLVPYRPNASFGAKVL